MSKLLRKAKRVGSRPVRYLIEIQVERLSYSVDKGLEHGAVLSVAFHRGPKVSITESNAIYDNGGAEWHADSNTLSQVCTLYLDKDRSIMKKMGKITVRRRAWSQKQGMHHVGVGTVEIDLAEYVGISDQNEYRVLALSKSGDSNGTLAVNIKTRWLKDVEGVGADDTLSSVSIDSATSVVDVAGGLSPRADDEDPDESERLEAAAAAAAEAAAKNPFRMPVQELRRRWQIQRPAPAPAPAPAPPADAQRKSPASGPTQRSSFTESGFLKEFARIEPVGSNSLLTVASASGDLEQKQVESCVCPPPPPPPPPSSRTEDKWHKAYGKIRNVSLNKGGALSTKTQEELEELRKLNQQLQAENKELMQQLISTKIAYAEMQMQMDQEQKQLCVMKKRLRLFSTHATALEVKWNVARSKNST